MPKFNKKSTRLTFFHINRMKIVNGVIKLDK